MLFTHLHFYTIHAGESGVHDIFSSEDLYERLEQHRAKPLADSEGTRLGWTAPAGKASDMLLHEIQQHRLMSVLKQRRIIPPAVIEEDLDDLMIEFEQEHKRLPSRKEKSALKADVYENLLPRAFIRNYRFFVWWDTKSNVIGVGTPSRTDAEDVLNLLRETLESLKVTPYSPQDLPIRKFTDWVVSPDTRPSWLRLGDKATFHDPGDKTKFTANNADLEGDEAQTMVANGYQVIQLHIKAEDLATVTIDESFSFKGIKFAEKVIEEAYETEAEDALMRLESDFAVAASAMTQLRVQLTDCMGGHKETRYAQPVTLSAEQTPSPAKQTSQTA